MIIFGYSVCDYMYIGIWMTCSYSCIDIDALYVIKVVSNKYFIGSKSLGKRLQWMDSYRTFFHP